MPVKGKKTPLKAKVKKVKKVAKAPAKKKIAAKKAKPVKSSKPKKVAAKKAKKVAKKPAKKTVVAKKPKKLVKAKAVKKPVRKVAKVAKAKKAAPAKKSAVKKSPVKQVKAAKKRSEPTKSNVTIIKDFVREQTQKEPMSVIEAKPKVKKAKTQTQPGQASGLSMVGVRPYTEQPGEEYMNEAQRQHFRQMLNQWKQELMQEVDRTVHHMQDEAANFPDPNDRATQEEEFSLELRTRDRERKLIKKIEEALSKIDQNEYGYCESCGVEIGIRRLEARPTATLCIDCKTLDEIKERQMGNL